MARQRPDQLTVRIIDISQPVGTGIAVWPGDQPFELAWSQRREAGAAVNAATLHMSAHTGTHLDGFRHVSDAGATAALMPLDACLGPVRVLEAPGRGALGPALLDGIDPGRTPRVLFRTRAAVDQHVFPESFAWLAPELATRLVRDGFRLVGTDAPSVDARESESLEAHHILADGGVVGLENVVLTEVPPGDYILVALPLRLTESDSSPVRAVLLQGGW